MKKEWNLIIIAALVLAVAGGGVYWALFSGEPSVQKVQKVQKEKSLRAKKPAVAAKSERRMRLQAQQRVMREKPVFEIEDEEDRVLNAVQRELLEQIRAAIDTEDKKTLIRLVQKMQASNEWPDGIPVPIRKAAIAALGWFGAGCLPEIAGFLADGNEEVMEMAVNQYEEALSDPDLSDRERSQILSLATKVITDDDSLDCMMMEFNNMRHSVAVETFIDIMQNGNAAAKAKIAECIEFYTTEDDIKTVEDLQNWLVENPDDDDDEDFYGRWDTEE